MNLEDSDVVKPTKRREPAAYYIPWTLLFVLAFAVCAGVVGETRRSDHCLCCVTHEEKRYADIGGLSMQTGFYTVNDFSWCQAGMSLSTEMVVIYLLGVVPPLLLYVFLKGKRRPIAYWVHAGWFAVVVIWALYANRLDARAMMAAAGSPHATDGTFVNPEDISVVRFGLIWSSKFGNGPSASRLLLASAVIAAAYLFERVTKERRRSRRALAPGTER
jgi:hypothetical protein